MKLKLLALLLTIISAICLATSLTACGTIGNNVNSTYYAYDSTLDKTHPNDYIELNNGIWKDSDGLNGTYTQEGDTVILYMTYSDGKAQHLSATITDGVIKYNKDGIDVVYKTASHEHKYDCWRIISEATCTQSGTIVQYCVCGKKDDVVTTKALGHSGAWETIEEATCTEHGTRRMLCTRCSEVVTDTIEPLGHNIEFIADEVAHYEICTRCNSQETVTKPENHDDDAPCSVCGYPFKYALNSDGTAYAVVGIYGAYSGNEIVIPSTHKDLPVVAVDKFALLGHNQITRVTVPDSITSIDKGAFEDCSALETITVDENNSEYASQSGILYNKAKNECIHIPSSIKGDIVIPDEMTRIGDITFYNCIGLTGVTVGDGVTSIGDEAFKDCGKLTTVVIGSGATRIGESAFSNCSELTNVTIGNNVTSISENAFRDCNKLKNVTLSNSVTSIGESVFRGCSSLTKIIIPNSVTRIDDYAFEGCGGLTSVTFENSAVSIGDNAFKGCSGLTSLTFGDGVTSIGNRAFLNCSGLKSITIPNSTKRIGTYAFEGCSGLTSLTLGNGITSIGNRAFHNCSGLKSVNIPNGVTSINSYAFDGCSGLTSVTVGSSVTSIGYATFRNCSGLISITFNGTTGQWKTINKSNLWNYNTGNYTVQCTNGKLDKGDNVI